MYFPRMPNLDPIILPYKGAKPKIDPRAFVAPGAVIIGDLRRDRIAPKPGEVTHQVMVRVEDARGHCERARKHGAKIIDELRGFEYGERQYTAEDFAGHQWTFTESIADVAPETWGGTTVTMD